MAKRSCDCHAANVGEHRLKPFQISISLHDFFIAGFIAIHIKFQTKHANENNTIGCASAHRRGNISFLSMVRLGADISKTRYPKGSAFGLSGASWPPDGFEIAGCQAFGDSQSMGDGQVQMR